MPTRRKRPVLYEIVRHTRRSSDVGWRDKRRADAQKATTFEPLRASPAAVPRPLAATTASEVPCPAVNPAGSANFANSPPGIGAMNVADARQASTEPAVRFMDGRLLLDLAWPGMTAAAVMAVILLALAFQIGRHNPLPPRPVSSAEPPAATTAKTADPTLVLPKETRPWPAVPTHRPPDNAPVAVLTPPAARTVEAPPQPAAQAPQQPAEQANQAAYAFKPGYDYVVVQYFKLEHKDVAIDAARFLQANGVDAVVVPKKSDVEVVATTPFLLDQKDAAAKAAAQKACAALKDKIRTLGRAFAKQQAAAKKPQYAFDQPAERLEHPHTK